MSATARVVCCRRFECVWSGSDPLCRAFLVFRAEHGHCNVPSTYPKNQPLAYWVFKQRGQHRIYQKKGYATPGAKKQMCHMTPERIAMLDSIAFEWNPPRRATDR